MSDNNDYLRTSSRSFRLTADVTALMLKGAGYAAAFCIAVLIIAWIWLGISALLPDESKEAFDPTPEAFVIELLPDFS
jgi:hypothetical protein